MRILILRSDVSDHFSDFYWIIIIILSFLVVVDELVFLVQVAD